MSRPVENILEDILDRLQSSGGGMQQSTAAQIAQAIQLAGQNNSGSNSNNSQQATSALGTLASAASSAAGGLLEAESSSDAMGAMTSSLKKATSVIPGFGGAIGVVIDAAQKFYDFMNGHLEVYQKFNTSGMQATNGMMDLYGALAVGRLNLNEFMNATATTRDVIASMGSDGVRDFGAMLNTVIHTQKAFGSLNMTNEQMASYLAGNLKRQKAYGSFEKMSQDERDTNNRSYMENLNKYSKSLGMSTDALNEKLNKSADTVTGFGTNLALTNSGIDPALAKQTSDNLNIVLGSFGSFGDEMNTQLARYIAVGDIDLDTDFGQLYQSNDQIRLLFEKSREMATSGLLASEAGAKQLQSMMSSKGLVKSFDDNLDTVRNSFGDDAANRAILQRNQLNNYEADIAKVDQFWNNTMTNLNVVIGDIYGGFRTNIAEGFMSFSTWYTEGDGQQLQAVLNMTVDEVGNEIGSYLRRVGPAVGVEIDNMINWMGTQAAKFEDWLPSYDEITKAILPSWLYDIVMDGAPIANGTEFIGKMEQAVDRYVDDVNKGFQKASAEFMAHPLDTMGAAYDSVGTAISDVWSKRATQTTINKNITQNTSNVTQPVAIQRPDTLSSAQQSIAASNSRAQQYKDAQALVKEQIDLQRAANSIADEQLRLQRKRLKQAEGGQIN